MTRCLTQCSAALILFVWLSGCSQPGPNAPPTSDLVTPAFTATRVISTLTSPAATASPAGSLPNLTPTLVPQTAGTPESPTATAVAVGNGRPVVVDMTSFAFRPERLAATVGYRIQLDLRNLDVAIPHIFEIPALGVSEVVGAAATRQMEFVAGEAGTYIFLCPLDTAGVNHAEAGMLGELIVGDGG